MRLHIFFVIHQIRENSFLGQWRYINTKENPAEEASRSINPQDLIHNSSWLNGQTFLWEREFAPWTRGKINFDISSDDPEAHVLTIRAQPEMMAMIPECLRKSSHCKRANRAISVCARFKSLLAIRKRKQPEEVKNTKEENKEVK